LALLLDEDFDFFAGIVENFFDPRRMNAAVGDELVQRLAGNLAADRIETADDDHAGRVVDDDIDARDLFERADIPPFAADDPAFHFVARNIDGAGRAFVLVSGRIPLQR